MSVSLEAAQFIESKRLQGVSVQEAAKRWDRQSGEPSIVDDAVALFKILPDGVGISRDRTMAQFCPFSRPKEKVAKVVAPATKAKPKAKAKAKAKAKKS